MRIRATKPEFWQSETMAEFDFFTRLVLKALESYVDDNGVGKDSTTLFVTAAFPHDVEKSPEIFAKVARSLDQLSDKNLIVRYRVGGEKLVYVRQWRKWQYIDKPKQGRYPRPDGTTEYRQDVDETIGAGRGVTDPLDDTRTSEVREDCAHSSRSVPEDCPQIQSGEQGNRGSEEQGEKDLPDADASSEIDPLSHITESDFPDTFKPVYSKSFEEFWEHYPRKVGKRKAFNAWQAARRRASNEELIAGAQRYAADPNRSEQFTKHPDGWLARDGWLDEPLPARTDRPPTYRNGQPLQGADLRAAENANIASLFTTGPKAINQ